MQDSYIDHKENKVDGLENYSDLTLSDFSSTQTDKTDKTDFPSNSEFLGEIFGTSKTDICPIVVSFAGNPATISKTSWYGNPWIIESQDLADENNNYFSLSTFRPDESGKYRRQKKQFAALHAVMLDDVGTKIMAERITLPASWWLETSPGNFQVGYILAEPITETVIADRLMNAIINAGLCDPGASGPTSRLARLPVAVNGKHQPAFICRMTELEPDRRYTIDKLIEGLDIEIPKPKAPKAKVRRQQSEKISDGEEITIPRPTENIVINALQDRNLYKTPLGNGKHDITCPWVMAHTDGIDSGTAYFEPTDLWPIGGFKCLHGHCSDKHMRDLLAFLYIESKTARMKPTIRVIAGEIHRVVDAAEKQLAQTQRHYQRGGLIVTVVTDPGTKETRVQECNQPSLVQALAGAATWERFDGRSEEWVRIDPPARHVGVLYDATGYVHLPILNGLARQPYLRADNTIMSVAGYDAVSGMFGIFSEKEFSVPKNPNKEQALAALDMLSDMLAEFCFATATDRSAALCAILTSVIRPSLSAAPMIHIKAHQVGSGKSYLCRLITIFATPQYGTPSTFPKDCPAPL